jgi:hypothetical protein
MIEINKPNAPVINLPVNKSTVGTGTAWNATVAFQDAVLDPNVQPGDIYAALEGVRTSLNREGEDKARAIAASQELRERENYITESIGRVDPVLAAEAILRQPYRDTYLEERSIDKQINVGLAEEESLGPIEAVDVIAETSKKFAHITREIEKRLKGKADESWLSTLGDLGGSLLFWNTIRSRVGLTDKDVNYLNPLQAEQVFNEVYDVVFNTRTMEEFIPKFNEYLGALEERSAIFGVNDQLVIEGLQRLLDFQNPGTLSFNNFNSVLDYADVLGSAYGLTKAIRSPAVLARVTGNPGLAARLNQGAHNALNGTQQLPLTGNPNISIANNVSQLQANALRYVNNHFDEISKYRTPDQLQQVQALTEDTMRTNYPNRVIDVRWQKVDQTGADQFTEFMDVYLGTQKGQGFSTEQWATNQAIHLGITDFSVVQDVSTRKWLIKTQHRPTESRSILMTDLDDFSTSTVGRLMSGARQLVSDRMASTAALGELRAGQLAEQFTPLIKNVEKLNKRAKNDFNVIATKGLNDGSGKWYTDAELVNEYNLAFNRNPTDTEITAYHSFKAISDIEWEIRNRGLREVLAFENWKELNFNGSPSLAKKVDTVPTNAKVYDNVGNLVTPSPGDHIVQLMEGVPNPQGGFPISYMKLNSLTDLKELPNRVLGYAEGGRRWYDSEHFIKQANNVPTPEGIHIYHPRTGAATKTAKEAREVAEAMNDANRIYKEWSAGTLTNAAADAQLGVHRTLAALDIHELDRLVQAKNWNPKEVWEVVPDRGLPSGTVKAKASTNSIDYTTNINDSILFSDRLGRMYYSQRGAPIKSLETGNPLPTVNVFESLSRSVSSAIRTGAWNKYRIESVNSFVTTAKQFNAIENIEVLNQSPWEIIKTAVIKHSDAKVESKLKEMKKQILWNIDPATSDSALMDSIRRRAREWIFDRDGVLKNFPNLTDFIENRVISNPLTSLRGITFDRHVGMFGIDQLLVQSNTLMSAAATYGTRAATDTIPWTLALRAAETVRGFKDPRAWDSFLGTLAKSHNIPTTELRRRLKALDAVGVMKVGGEYADLQSLGNYVESSRVFGAIDKVRKTGRVFFNWAEQNNRLVAFNIAYDMAKREGMDPLSQQGLDFIALKTQDFSFNMTRSATASWQRGIPSVFTQFFGYTGRYIDALYGKNFTPMQKAKFALANFIMFGAAGIPFGDNIAEYYGVKGETTDGLLDHVLSEILGVETAFRGRTSPAQQIEEMAREIMLDGTSALFATPAGDTVLDLFNLFRPTGKVWNLQYAFHNADPLTVFTKGAVDAITDFITPWGRLEKAWLIHQTERMEDRLGRKVLEDIEGYSSSAAIAAAMGIQLEEVDDLYRQYSDQTIQRNLDKFLAETLALERNKAFWGAVDNNETAYNEGKDMTEILGALLDNDPARKVRVLDEANKLFAENGSREWNSQVQSLKRGY